MAASAARPGESWGLGSVAARLAGPTADSCQTVAVWAAGGLLTQGRAQAEAAASSSDHGPIQPLSILTQLSSAVLAPSTDFTEH